MYLIAGDDVVNELQAIHSTAHLNAIATIINHRIFFENGPEGVAIESNTNKY